MKNALEERYKYKIIYQWYKRHHWAPFDFQKKTWDAFLAGKSGLVNAPTGSGKTFAIWIPAVLDLLEKENFDFNKTPHGLQIIWVTPLRALAKDIQKALKNFCDELNLNWQIELRTGDTPTSQRTKQLKKSPTCLITTPESLHILFSQKESINFFKNVKTIVIDEWHELLSTKRGVQTELAISRIRSLSENNLGLGNFCNYRKPGRSSGSFVRYKL